MGRKLISAVAGLLVLFVGSLAFNAASGQDRWPGPLDFVRTHPWVVLLLLIPLALLGLWQSPSRERAVKPASATYRLPPRNTNFTGRDDALRALRQRLTSGNEVAVQVVHGLGGVGKTQLAIEYAYRHLSKYRFVAFLDAEHPDLIASQFASLARELGLTEIGSEQLIPRVYGKLVDRRPWLVIFDNGEKPADLTHALPTGELANNGHVIVTTRVSGWSSRAGVLDLEVFTRQESVELLTRRVPGMAAAVADQIAEQLGDLPLALEQAAGYMDYNHTAPAEYLALLTSRLEEMIARGELADRPSVVVATLWQLSVRQLAPESVRLLELCALLAPEPIPLDLLTLTSAADPLAWDTTVGALAGLGLARRTNAHLVVHRLVQAAVRAAMPEGPHRVVLYRALASAVPHDIHGDPTASDRWQELLPHVLAVTRDEPPPESAPEAAALLRLAATYLLQIGDRRLAVPLCERALSIDESLPDREAEVGSDLSTLAQIYRELEEPDQALPYAERALQVHEACLPAGDPAIATDLATLARILRQLNEHTKALPLAERALAIDEAAHGPDNAYVSFDLVALASIHGDLGDHATALPLVSRALEIREATYAPDHLYIGYALMHKAQLLHILGDPTADKLAERGAQILRTQLGATHPKTEDAFEQARKIRG